MKRLTIDREYLVDILERLLAIPSPTGYTDAIVHFVGEELQRLEVPFELTRRGAIRADLKGEQETPDRAIVSHLDTLGAMVTSLKDNGRLEVLPIGTWSSRFAEGARVTILSDGRTHRGTILPLKASGHVFHDDVDRQPVDWYHVELRVDEIASSRADLEQLGIQVGDTIAVDPEPEINGGFVNSRHLDDKAGVAAVLAAAKALVSGKAKLPLDCHLLFTIAEEVGSGASSVLHGDVAEMVAVDNGTVAPGQSSTETSVTIAMMDSAGPFDWHLTHRLIDLCKEHDVAYRRDVFDYYRSDAASAVTAGNDVRTALIGPGVDASHGYERTHLDGIEATATLLTLYIQSQATVKRDRYELGPIEGFPTQPG